MTGGPAFPQGALLGLRRGLARTRMLWPRYYRFYRRLGFDRPTACWNALRYAGKRVQAYRRGPAR